MTSRLYLDANATTPLHPSVREAVARAWDEAWANPSSLHGSGRAAARLLSDARETTAAALGCATDEVVFTSGGTESDRLAVLGALRAAAPQGHVVCSAVEHPAIRSLVADLERRGEVDVSWVRPEPDGRVTADAVVAALRDDTALVALMWANNETGVLQPVHEVAAAAAERGIACVVDAVQTVGKLGPDLPRPAGALLTASAHKLHGPTGVGALVVPRAARWTPPWPASQEQGRRGGTTPVPLIVGLATALELADDTRDRWTVVASLRDRLERSIVGALGEVEVNGTAERTPNTTNLRFRGLSGRRLLARLDAAGLDLSDGSACTSGSDAPSHVLLAQGLDETAARESLRFSLPRDADDALVDRAVAAVIETVETLRRTDRRRRRQSHLE